MQDKAYDLLPTIRSRELRNNATSAERKLWAALRNRQLDGVRFNRQVPIDRFICDFVARSEKLIVEVDGGQHAGSRLDRSRTETLQRLGYRVIRFWNNDVLENIEGVVSAIVSVLKDKPSPSPSRFAGGQEET